MLKIYVFYIYIYLSIEYIYTYYVILHNSNMILTMFNVVITSNRIFLVPIILIVKTVWKIMDSTIITFSETNYVMLEIIRKILFI